jgi:chitin synthase
VQSPRRDLVCTSYILKLSHVIDHDFRGTKGDNGAAKDLGGAKKVKGDNGKDVMEVELPTAREDVDQLWTASRAALKMKPSSEKEHRDTATKQADRDRNSRTNVVIAWIGTNMYVMHAFLYRDPQS